MKSKVFIASTLVILSAHVLMLLFTEYSFVGYLSDIWIPLLLIAALFTLLRRSKTILQAKNIITFYLIVLVVFYGVIGVKAVRNGGMFSTLNTFNISGFHYYKIDNSFYNGYFEPVGAYSGGEGNIWITETPLIFPLIEKTTHYEPAVLWDYSLSEFDGRKVDQNKAMRQTIKSKLNND